MATQINFGGGSGRRRHYSKPPSPIGLIKQITPGADPAGRARKAGALGAGTPIVPRNLRKSGGSTQVINDKWEIARFFDDQSLGMDPDNPDYDESGQGYLYQNLAEDPVSMMSSSVDTSPAPISISPTSTTNWRRPRTVAAGYDATRMVLTVVFRDGTMYNYYSVSKMTWNSFRNAYSKGRYIRMYLDGRRRGPAQFSGVPEEYREALYRIARTAQYMSGGPEEVGAIQDPATTSRPQSFSSRRFKRALYQPKYTPKYDWDQPDIEQ